MSFMHSPIFYRPFASVEPGSRPAEETEADVTRAAKEEEPPTPVPAPAVDASGTANDDIGEEAATVKFFHDDKGYGILTSGETGEAIYLSAAVLAAAGRATLEPGTPLVVVAEDAEPRPKVIEIVSIEGRKPVLPAPLADGEEGRADGKVTSWKEGFGFVRLDDARSVFVHRTAVPDGVLRTGSRVGLTFRKAERGLVAVAVEEAETA